MISAATYFLFFFSNVFISFFVMISIWLSLLRNVVPSLRVEFNTIKSRFFLSSLLLALISSLFVSNAKPTKICSSVFIRPSSAAMSFVGHSCMLRLSFSRFNFIFCDRYRTKVGYSCTQYCGVAIFKLCDGCIIHLVTAFYIDAFYLFRAFNTNRSAY